MAYALLVAEKGDKHPDVKPLQGFHGAGVLEILDDFKGDTYRLAYTIDYGSRLYVLHAFKKKSHRGIRTPKRDVDLIKQRYAEAEEDAKKEPDHE
jgi:phage-related protein